MHLAERRLDAHIHGRKVGVGSHDADNAAGGGIETGRNHTQNHILASKDARNSPLVLDKDGRGVILLHQLSSLLHRGPDAHCGRRQAVQHRLEGRARHLGPERLDVLDDLLRLAGAEFRLHAFQSIVKAARRGVGTFQLLHGIVEALGDVEHARDVLVLVHDGQVAEALANHQVKRIGSARVGPRAERVLGHDLGDGDTGGLQPGADNAEGKVLGRENAGNAVVIVGHKHAVLALGGHELRGLSNGGRGLDLKSLARLQGEDGSRRCLARLPGAAGEVLLLGEVALQLAADSLQGGGISASGRTQKKEKPAHLISLGLLLAAGAD